MSDLDGFGSSDDAEFGEQTFDAGDRRPRPLVLRPDISSLPSIGDDSDDDSSPSEPEVVFSSINWEAQAELQFDRPSSLAGSDEKQQIAEGDKPPLSATPRAAPLVREGSAQGAAVSALERQRSDDADGEADEPYAGRGWLSGAAGRLANVASGRNRIGATDEDQVAAAARDAAALLQQQQLAGQQQQDAAATASPASLAGGPGSTGPVAIDLRQSIAEVAQRNEQQAVAAAAQRASQAKATAAQRRLAAGSDEGSDDGSDEEVSPKKVRPVPPSALKASPPPQVADAAARLTPSAPAPVVPGEPGAMSAAPDRGAHSAAPVSAKDSPALASKAGAMPAASAPKPRSVTWAQSDDVHVIGSSGGSTAVAARGSAGGATAVAPSSNGGATAVASKSSSIGTDVTGLRPSTRSSFVCTTERQSEELAAEEERLQDIRAYLKARSGAAAARPADGQDSSAKDEAASVAEIATSTAERQWPEPPAVVAQRVSSLAERPSASLASANGTTAVPKALAERSRVVSNLGGVRLLGALASSPLVPPSAAASGTRAGGPQPAAASSGAGSGGASGEVRVLALACVPRSGMDTDSYSHVLPGTEAAAAAAASAAASQLAAALGNARWADVLGAAGTYTDARLSGWVSARPGAEQLFAPLRIAPHSLSQTAHRTSSSGGAPSPIGGGGDASSGGTFVCMVTRGALRQPSLLRSIVDRAACLGLTLRGLQVLYADDDAAAAVVSATPHRPQAYTGAAVLALCGANDALRRWSAELGPPDAALAARSEPSSLHALYGSVARHITCSYDSGAAAREVAVLFGGSSAGPGGGDTPLSPALPVASPRGAAAGAMHIASPSGSGSAAESAAAVTGLQPGSAAPQTQSLALPACGAEQQSAALWAAQHLLWCGYSLRGLLVARTNPPQQGPAGDPSLILEVSKEEAADQLPLLLSNLPVGPTAPSSDGAAQLPSRPLLPELLCAQPPQSSTELHALPPPHVAEDLLAGASTAAAAAQGRATTMSSSQRAPIAGKPEHHGEDQVTVVALQSRPLHAAALVLAALVAHVTALAGPSSDPSPVGRLELVACRMLRQVPSDIASCLVVQHPATSSGGGATAGLRAPQRLVISHPAMLAVLHGPGSQARVAQLLAAAVQRFGIHAATEASAAVAGAAALHSVHGGSGGDTASWQARLDALLRQYPGAAVVPLLAGATVAQSSAKRALAYAFSPAHVFLDAGLHDGVHRPTLPAASGAVTRDAATPLSRLLIGPERLPAVIAVDYGAVHRNVLPRLLKQLWREGYAVHAATSCTLRADGAAAAAMAALSGQPAVLLHVSRSNAVLHLRSVAASLAAATGGAGSGLHACGTWREAVAVVSEVWPEPASCESSINAASEPTRVGLFAPKSAPRRFVRPEGSRLLQLTNLIVTPSTDLTGGELPGLDWPHLADALEALHGEGFRLAGLRVAAVGPRDLADLARASCRISPRQQQAVHAAAAAATAAVPDWAAGLPGASSGGLLPPPSNVAMVALARDNAVTALQILMDEASRSTGSGAGPASGGEGGAPVGAPAAPPRGPAGGQRGAAAALAALATCVSVSHSPAAAEQQVSAAYDGLFGAGGVSLLQ
ncbi:hypothetical protein GPECTOR_44g21 [Gonium pectorale]|uniref:Nucleoside diphosphate kinase-like domain-containing protein n=1 Tax=Gonium pectorale TaxID=33097 RepID=A0A150G921_GONPE|nr:hypothetical protein GPECTOR_44g21 [Gonium pectorale]|eukprot:KXZ46342.1 hypothetical protein GPECTOR_44g21 [Gonium pectorale]